MKSELRATPDGPLHIADRQGASNYSNTLEYIPGTTLRGALAMTYLERADLQQQVDQQLREIGWTFRDYFGWLFLSGRVRFPNLYPSKVQASFVTPLSARSCKQFPGFPADAKSAFETPHGVCDVLLFEPDEFRCTANLRSGLCKAAMEERKKTRFYESEGGAVKGARSVSPDRRTLTRTAMENPTETVLHRALYSLEAIEEGGGGYVIFTGVLDANPSTGLSSDHEEIPLELLRKHLEGPMSVLSVGAAKTRGLGTVRLELANGTSGLPPLKERFDRLQQVWSRVPSDKVNMTVFTLTLNSDAIVLDKLWRYCSVLNERVIEREAPGAPLCCLERWFTRTRIISGWNSAHRLPKEDELAIVKGASFLYTTTTDRDILLAWLQQVEEQSIGERRVEGFGQVIACHPFHWEVPER